MYSTPVLSFPHQFVPISVLYFNFVNQACDQFVPRRLLVWFPDLQDWRAATLLLPLRPLWQLPDLNLELCGPTFTHTESETGEAVCSTRVHMLSLAAKSKMCCGPTWSLLEKTWGSFDQWNSFWFQMTTPGPGQAWYRTTPHFTTLSANAGSSVPLCSEMESEAAEWWTGV